MLTERGSVVGVGHFTNGMNKSKEADKSKHLTGAGSLGYCTLLWVLGAGYILNLMG